LRISSLQIVDREHDNISCGANEIGELWLKTPSVMLGYVNNVEMTMNTIDNDGWLRTGDIGYFDCDRYLYITDRSKDMIKVRGWQVLHIL